jgi:aspartate/methionine/tyrosine aminotransferase
VRLGGRAGLGAAPDVCGGDHTGILAVHSLSKRSNLAGYRCAFVAGDRAVVGELLAVRKNLGLHDARPAAARDARRPRRRRARAEQHARYAGAARR